MAAELAIPLTAGGGIRTLDEARAVVRAGADKITVNTAAVEAPELISELSQNLARKRWFWLLTQNAIRTHAAPRWEVRVRGGRDATPLDALVWAQRGVELGAGEILLTSMDRDGTQSGFDVTITRRSPDCDRSSDRFRRCENSCRFRGDFFGWSSGRGAGCFHFSRRRSTDPRR